MTHLPNNKALVEIPEGASDIQLHQGWCLTYFTSPGTVRVNLPGSYSILCTRDTVTEEIAREIVNKETRTETVDYNAGGGGRIKYTVYKDYEHDEYELDTALESLSSLLKAKGVEGNYVIVNMK